MVCLRAKVENDAISIELKKGGEEESRPQRKKEGGKGRFTKCDRERLS